MDYPQQVWLKNKSRLETISYQLLDLQYDIELHINIELLWGHVFY